MAIITLATVGAFLTESFGAYFISRKLDKLFSNKVEFISELSKIVNTTIEEYGDRYPQLDKGSKFSFYKSQRIVGELLKYRIMSNDEYDLDNLEKALSEEKNVIPPTQEQIKNFYSIFISQIQKNDKLKKLEIKETFEEEIFIISSSIKELNSKIDNVISTYNGDLEAQWKDRLEAYIETLKQFKPQTALNLLHKLEHSFDISQSKPNDKLIALIKHQEGICLSLLDNKDSYLAFIKAYNKDKSNLKYKEQAAFAYFKIEDTVKTQTLMKELLHEDEYNVVGWALKIMMSDEGSMKGITDSLPAYVTKNRRFQLMLFNYYASINKFNIIHELKEQEIIISSSNISPITIDIDSFNEGIYLFNLLISAYLQENNYADFVYGQFRKTKLLNVLNKQIKSIVKKVRNSEIDSNCQRLYFFDALADYILIGDKKYALKMRDYISNDKEVDSSFILICASILQIEGYDDEALELIDGFRKKSFELTGLKVYIYLKNNNTDEYLKAIEELYNSVEIVEDRIIQVYIQYIFILKKLGHFSKFEPEIFYQNKTFFDQQVGNVVELIVHILRTDSLNPYQTQMENLVDHFKDSSLIILYIANAYYHAKQYELAIPIYEKHLNVDDEGPFLYTYIYCLYDSNSDSERLLAILKNWRRNFRFNPNLLRMEYNLSSIILDWERCLEIVEYALSIEPDIPSFTECRLLTLDKLNDEKVEKAIDEYLDFENKVLTLLPRVVDVLTKRGRLDQALELLYEYYSDDNPLIQTLYFNTTVQYSQECDKGQLSQSKLLEYETIENGHFVKYSLNGEVKFVEISNNSDKKSLVDNLLKKKKGESFDIKRTISSQKDKIVVLRVMDKYLYAHDKILEKANDPYSGLPMESFHLDPSNNEDLIDFFKKIFGEDGDAREKYINDSMEEYYRGAITYSEIIIRVCRNDYFGGYFHLIYSQKGIVTIPKLFYDRLEIPDNKPYMIDFSSLPILYQLSNTYEITYPTKFYISKYLVEILRNRIRQLKAEPKSELSIVTTTHQVSKIEHTEEQRRNNIKYLENLLEWINLNCDEIVSVRFADMKRTLDGKESGIKDGSFFVDYILNTILVREDEDAILISDDLIYTKFLKLPLAATVSSEVYTKRIWGDDHPALREFLKNRYIGFDYSSSCIIEEFDKKLKNTPNSYLFIIDNYMPTAWQSFVEVMMHVVSISELSKEIKIREIRVIIARILQFCDTQELIDTIKGFIQWMAIYNQCPQEVFSIIATCFAEEEINRNSK